MDVAAVCKVGAVPLGRVGIVSASMQRGRSFALSVRVVVHQSNTLRVTSRCNGTSESGSGGLPAKVCFSPLEVRFIYWSIVLRLYNKFFERCLLRRCELTS